MRRRVTAVEAFHASIRALDRTEETQQMAKALMLRVATRPESAPAIPGTPYRMVKSSSYGAFPAVRLFYGIDDEKVTLLHIEQFDEMEEMMGE